MAAASGRSGTRRSSGRSGTRRSTSNRSRAGRSGIAVAHRSTAVVLLDLGQADLAEDVPQRLLLLAAAGAVVLATGNWSRSRAGRGGRSTGHRSRGRAGRGSRSARHRSGGGTGRGRSTAARGRGRAVCSLAEQAGVGAVEASETHQGSGNPCELHSKTPRHPSGREREVLAIAATEHVAQRAGGRTGRPLLHCH